MKLLEFICKHTTCPMCNFPLDCLLHVELSHTLLYKLIHKNNRFIFAKGKELFIVQHNGCNDCAHMPDELVAENRIEFPPILKKFSVNKSYYGNAFISVECPKYDFGYNSTDFNIFSEEREIDIAWERLAVGWDKVIINDYGAQKTSIIVPKTSKDTGLIPLDKWPLGDKIKLSEKIEKLLVLI